VILFKEMDYMDYWSRSMLFWLILPFLKPSKKCKPQRLLKC